MGQVRSHEERDIVHVDLARSCVCGLGVREGVARRSVVQRERFPLEMDRAVPVMSRAYEADSMLVHLQWMVYILCLVCSHCPSVEKSIMSRSKVPLALGKAMTQIWHGLAHFNSISYIMLSLPELALGAALLLHAVAWPDASWQNSDRPAITSDLEALQAFVVSISRRCRGVTALMRWYCGSVRTRRHSLGNAIGAQGTVKKGT